MLFVWHIDIYQIVIRIAKNTSDVAKSTDFKIKMASMAPVSFYRHRFFRVIADLTVRLTELAENASTSFWPLHLQDAINLKMVKINVDQHQIVHLMLDLQLDSQKLAHPTAHPAEFLTARKR